MDISKLIDKYSNIEIKGIKTNTKLVENGDLFVCLKGSKNDSHDFIEEAIKNGAVFAITDRNMYISIPYLKVKDTFDYSIDLFQKFYDNPQNKLKLIGVTGTDGKTTVSTIIQSLIGNDICGYIGTNGYNCLDYGENNHVNTTPAPESLYKIFNEFSKRNMQYVSMEASSEGFYYGRLNKLNFDVGIVTNVSSDHLNTHKTLKNYIDCKKLLMKQSKIQILNSSDKYFKEFKRSASNYYTYGYNKHDDLYIKDYVLRYNKTCINFIYDKNEYYLTSSLVGKYNIENLCAALLCLLKLGFSIYELIDKAKNLKIPGRMNFINKGQNFVCLLDYAHTANALDNLFKFVDELDVHKKIVVFGKPGERDKQARYEIGPILEKYNDLIILTAQDARSENIHEINNDILRDVKNKDKFMEIVDRKEAIKYALENAKLKDIVMILGKGVENGLNINGQIIEHNDLDEILKNLD